MCTRSLDYQEAVITWLCQPQALSKETTCMSHGQSTVGAQPFEQACLSLTVSLLSVKWGLWYRLLIHNSAVLL